MPTWRDNPLVNNTEEWRKWKQRSTRPLLSHSSSRSRTRRRFITAFSGIVLVSVLAFYFQPQIETYVTPYLEKIRAPFRADSPLPFVPLLGRVLRK